MTRVFHTHYNPPPSPSIEFSDRSMTRQDCADECDINNIVARAGAGLTAPLVCPEPVYVDLVDVPSDLGEILAIQMDAQARFDAMPSRVRERFGNDPVQLVAFLKDKSNLDEAVKLGLVKAPASAPAAQAPKQEPA